MAPIHPKGGTQEQGKHGFVWLFRKYTTQLQQKVQL